MRGGGPVSGVGHGGTPRRGYAYHAVREAPWQVGRGVARRRFDSAHLGMGLLDRFRVRRREAASSVSDEDARAFMEAMQPMSALAKEPSPNLIAEFSRACSAHPELKAVFLYEGTFGDEEPLVTVGLVLHDKSDPEPFVTISKDLEPQVRSLAQGSDYVFQLLDDYSLDRVPSGVSPIFERE